ncbi:MAG: hypothetical protein JXA61_07510 [Bacteroidales bacterium]|nr:hypothetical protein [Bacteroidales bacterium]
MAVKGLNQSFKKGFQRIFEKGSEIHVTASELRNTHLTEQSADLQNALIGFSFIVKNSSVAAIEQFQHF